MQEPFPDAELKVLLVEDDPAHARLVETLLGEIEGIDLAREATLGRALTRLRDDRFDAVLLDLSLPDAGGDDVIDRVLRAAPEAAVVVSSGQAVEDRLLAEVVVRKGAEDLLPKADVTTARLARVLATAGARRRRLNAMRRHEADLAAALAASRMAHWSWRPGGRTVRLVGHLPAFARRPDEALVSGTRQPVRPLLRRLPRATRRCLLAAVRALLAGGDQLVVSTVAGEALGGRALADLMVETTADRDSKGRLVRLRGLLRGLPAVSEVEQLENQLITHLGHELRTPLTTIRGALGLLAHSEETPLAVATRALVDNAIINADRIGRVIGEALDSESEIAAGHRLQARRVPVGAYLYDALATRLPGLSAAGIALRLTPEGRGVASLVDAGRLRRALEGLSDRLLIDGGQGGRFILDVATDRGVVWLRVARDAAARAPGEDQPPNDAAGQGDALPANGAWRVAVALAA
jgi:CheY-like chemotaxis protein